MKDLTFEQKRSLSRQEAADQLTALADALREGGDAELELGPGTLGLRIPDHLHSELEVEIGDGEVELEIELKWTTAPTGAPRSRTEAAPAEKPKRKNTPAAAPRSATGSGKTGGAGSGKTGSTGSGKTGSTGSGRTRGAKRTAAKSS
ncbi:amphi-Trp domain-containing protein [Streptomyces luteogriseus]|uniref:amphi-Trp domain-containing protein n=1 Tax=Streptomyces luteogriseus TaxID=68233 RepID=UPI0038186712